MEYGDFAYCYDIFMDETPYERWSEFLADTLKKEGIEDGLVLDLGCGTGRLTNALSDMGYDMIGIDSSREMLGVAAEGKGSRDILYLCQDMREFELYGTVRAVVSVCDCINYITDTKDLLKVFKLVNNYLDPKGIFIFDINTEYKYKELLSDNTFAESREGAAFIWENDYDSESRINEYSLTFFTEEEGGLYRRFEESHYQRAYSVDEIKDLIEESGMILEGLFDDYSDEKPGDLSERITFICREQGK